MTTKAEQLQRKLQPKNKRLGIAFLLIAAGAGLWSVVSRSKSQTVLAQSSGLSQTPPGVSVPVQSLVPTLTPQTVEVTGTVQAELTAPISSKIMARVQNVLVREGDHVRQGQALVLLDARDMDASISQADANLRAAGVGYDNARTSARMEALMSKARIAEANAKITRSEAELQAATARQQLVQAGPRRQERERANLAVTEAMSTLNLAERNLKRMTPLFEEGAISAQQLDQYRSQYEVAKSHLETAQQAQSIAEEGSRVEEIQAADQSVRQADASLREAQAGLQSAQASAMQTEVRTHEIQGAQAQIGQSEASLHLTKVNREYAVLTAPFDGIVTRRTADPGAMATPGNLLLIVQGGKLRLEAIVPESVLGSVNKEATVSLTFDALKARTTRGHVVEIAPQGDANSHTFIVKINFLPGSGTSVGMFGRARFTIGKEKRLLIPAAALLEREGLSYIYVLDDAHFARLRMVTVGAPVGKQIPVLSGVNPGERFVSAGTERLTDGAHIEEGAR